MLEKEHQPFLVPEKSNSSIYRLIFGGLLLGASLPLASFLQSALGKPQIIESELVAFAHSPGLEAFPYQASNALICQPSEPAIAPDVPLDTPNTVAVHLSSPFTILPEVLGTITANVFPVSWPQIHAQARLAKVPILMYHDVLTPPQVFFDLTPEDLEAHFQKIVASGSTPISLDQLVYHLRTGAPLPQKPVLLTFDDGYAGHYEYVYPLLRQYQFPAVFAIFPGKVDGTIAGRSTLTWEQLAEMAADPLVTIAAHSVTHPPDLRQSSDEDLQREVVVSKQRLEEKLGIPIQYFVYPAGHYDERVAAAVADAGYLAALTMRESDERFAGESESLLTIERFGQSNLERVLNQASGGFSIPERKSGFDFSSPIRVQELTLEEIPLALITGGHPVTVHADSRYQVHEILERTNAIAAVDGGFFSLKYLDSNVMIGPVLSQSTRTFVPGNASENPLLNGRPLVLITPQSVQFIPFDAARHNSLAGLQAEAPTVTDAFVAAAWLVKNGEAMPASSFGSLFDFEANRHRAFWGINQAGEPVIGVSKERVDSVTLGRLLAQAGLRDAVMVDSGASTALAYRNEPLVTTYTPRPVPHIVALIPPNQTAGGRCPLVMRPSPESTYPQASEPLGKF